MKYRIYFEFYCRKLQTEVDAANEQDAKEQIKRKIKFIKIEKEESKTDWAFITEFNKIMGKK